MFVKSEKLDETFWMAHIIFGGGCGLFLKLQNYAVQSSISHNCHAGTKWPELTSSPVANMLTIDKYLFVLVALSSSKTIFELFFL